MTPMHRGLPAVAISALLISASSGAQEVSARGPIVITITKTDCSRLVRHVPAADVAYQPGVDVRGRKVASADLDPAAAALAAKMLPEVLEIPITINPIGYAQRKAANKQKAAAAGQVTQNTAAIGAAQTRQSSLVAQKAGLDAQQAAYQARFDSLKNDVVATTGGATPTARELSVRTARIADLTQRFFNTSDYLGLQQQRAANATAITDGAASLAARQANDPTLRQAYTDTDIATQQVLSAQSANGLDATQMKVGTVKYDIARNSFTFDDQPLLSEDQQRLAEACAKQGVR
jgi:hypothetical protein